MCLGRRGLGRFSLVSGRWEGWLGASSCHCSLDMRLPVCDYVSPHILKSMKCVPRTADLGTCAEVGELEGGCLSVD